MLNSLLTNAVLLRNFSHHGSHASTDPTFSNFSEVLQMLLLKKGVMFCNFLVDCMIMICQGIGCQVWLELTNKEESSNISEGNVSPPRHQKLQWDICFFLWAMSVHI
jgi:hypothetical protein